MEWVDAHCHLQQPWFTQDELPELLRTTAKAGVTTVVNCASDPQNYDFVIDSAKYNQIFVHLGIQPTIATEFQHTDMVEWFSRHRNKLGKKFVGIGEVGLDYYWVKDEQDRNVQRHVFKQIILAANELNEKLIIHSRKAESDCLNILEKYSEVPVLLHSFDGNLKETLRAMDLGYKITIPTNLTIRKNRRKTAKRAGLDNIMLETDSPFCQISQDIERNEPSYIPKAGEYLSKVLEVDVETIASQTTQNALHFYEIG